MNAFEHVLVLLSFVYAVALTHLLSCIAGYIRGWERLKFSWIHAYWVLNALILIVANWISFWDMRAIKSFSMGSVLLVFLMAFVNYLQAALVCPEFPAAGEIDLERFHAEQGRRYLAAFFLSTLSALVVNLVFGAGFAVQEWLSQNLVVAPMTVAAGVATIFARTRWVQAVCAMLSLGCWITYFATLQSALS